MPPKVSQMRQYRLRPLLLHTRVHPSMPLTSTSAGDGQRQQQQQRPFNTLTLRGSFSHAEMHNWLDECLPEMPQNIGSEQPNAYAQMSEINGGGGGGVAGFRRAQMEQTDAGQSVYHFRNVLTGTILQCVYG